MMRMPYFIQGALFGPTFIGLTFILKVACPTAVSAGCFADSLAVPIFLPLIFVYKMIDGGLIMHYELWFVILYWSLVGLLVGFIFDLRTPRSRY